MKVGIAGYGVVGQAVARMFSEPVIYDEPRGIGTRDEINACDVAFICVPTPRGPNGLCDTAIVQDVVSWLGAETIVIRSTVSPGTSRSLQYTYKRNIVFQPAFIGEAAGHPWKYDRDVPWAVLGGLWKDTKVVERLWRRSGRLRSMPEFHHVDWEVAEMVKYASNAFLATKVIFANEMYDIAKKLAIPWDKFLMTWTADPRVGRGHTEVTEERGFGGSCFPKDLAAMIAFSEMAEHVPTLLYQVEMLNEALRREAAKS